MSSLEILGFALGTSFASGLNLYATVAALGLLHRFGAIELPPQLHAFSHPWVLGLALFLFVVEFFADKVPYLDSLWDAIHTFIRPPAAALTAYAAFASVPEPWRIAAALASASVALTAHGTKASTRAAVNASPEPFSNWLASIGEDLTVLGSIWLVFNHPLIMLILVGGFIALAAWLIPKLFRLAKNGFQMLRARLRRKEPTEPVAKPS